MPVALLAVGKDVPDVPTTAVPPVNDIVSPSVNVFAVLFVPVFV